VCVILLCAIHYRIVIAEMQHSNTEHTLWPFCIGSSYIYDSKERKLIIEWTVAEVSEERRRLPQRLITQEQDQKDTEPP
jgi:hypothetical protein